MDVATSSATPSMGWLSRLRISTSTTISTITRPMTTEPKAFNPSIRRPNALVGAPEGGGPASRSVLAS